MEEPLLQLGAGGKTHTGTLQSAADAFVAQGSGGASSSSSSSSSSSMHVEEGGSGSGSSTKFTVVGMPGVERLNEKERSLCEHLRLSPLQFQQIKAVVVNISLVRGIVRKGDVAAKLVHVDAAKIGGVYDLVVQGGYATGEILPM